MPLEIERKFLVVNEDWRNHVNTAEKIIQGYLANTGLASIRVRIQEDKAYLNIKSMTIGVSREEYEYPFPLDDARNILKHLCIKPIIEKTRYFVEQAPHIWEIDVFEGENTGLIVAEIELNDPDESFTRPAWLGDEVSDDPRYYNVRLAEFPYNQW